MRQHTIEPNIETNLTINDLHTKNDNNGQVEQRSSIPKMNNENKIKMNSPSSPPTTNSIRLLRIRTRKLIKCLPQVTILTKY